MYTDTTKLQEIDQWKVEVLKLKSFHSATWLRLLKVTELNISEFSFLNFNFINYH